MYSSYTKPKPGIIFLWILTGLFTIINVALRKPISYKGYGGWIFFQILLAVFFLIILFNFLKNLPLKNGAKIVGIITLGLIFVLGGFKLIQGISSISRTSQESCMRRMAPSADLQDCDLRGITLTDGDLSGANLSGANFESARLSGVDLSDADLNHADFEESVQTDMNFSNAKLVFANFLDCRLDKVNFTGANLTYAFFYSDYRNSHTTFKDVIMQGAYLENVDLGETNPLEISGLEKDNLVNVDWVFNPGNYQSVCNGDPYPYGVPYQKVGGVHPTVVLVHKDEEEGFTLDNAVRFEQWEPTDVFETELVLCVDIHYRSIEDCRYGVIGANHAYRMRGTITTSLYEAATGKLLDSKAFTQEPGLCPDSMDFSSFASDNFIYGLKTPFMFVRDWLKPYVEVP